MQTKSCVPSCLHASCHIRKRFSTAAFTARSGLEFKAPVAMADCPGCK